MNIPTLEAGLDDANKLIDSLQSADANTASGASGYPFIPYSSEVHLPGGYFDLDGNRFQTAQVRELTGWDEEIISRVVNKAKPDSYGLVLLTILKQGVVSIGDEPVTAELLDSIYMVDWDALLLGIFIATFGPELSWFSNCSSCGDDSKSTIKLDDVEVVDLDPKLLVFDVNGRSHGYAVSYATGESARKGFEKSYKTTAEFTTMLLSGCVQAIDGVQVISEKQIQNISTGDRRTISKALLTGGPEVNLNEVTTTCESCDAKNPAVLSLAAMFRTKGLGL